MPGVPVWLHLRCRLCCRLLLPPAAAACCCRLLLLPAAAACLLLPAAAACLLQVRPVVFEELRLEADEDMRRLIQNVKASACPARCCS